MDIGFGPIFQGLKWLLQGGKYLYDKIRQRAIVKLITSKDDPDVDEFVKLYVRVIDECSRIEPEEIIKFIGNHDPILDSHLCDYLFVCKKGDDLIGFLKVIYNYRKGFLYIAYLGQSDATVRNEASNALVSHLLKFIEKELTGCKAILFEIDGSYGTATRNSRVRHFRSVVGRTEVQGRKLKCFEIGIEFFQPEIPGDNCTVPQRPSILLFVPYNYWNVSDNLELRESISKPEVLSFINFIYGDIYRRVYLHDKVLNNIYQGDLENLITKYEVSLPREIPILT